MIQFKERPIDSPIELREGGSARPLFGSPIQVGEKVIVHPDVPLQAGREDWVRCLVTGNERDRIRIRAEHSFYPRLPGERLIATGDEFEVSLDHVFVIDRTPRQS
jgi:hypothetical protein